MKRLIGLLVMVSLWSGCEDFLDNPLFDDDTAGPTKGPEGQPLDVYQDKDSKGNRIEYEFYISGTDTIKHGKYRVFYENGDTSYSITFREGKRNGLALSYTLTECVEDSKGNMECRDLNNKQFDHDWYRDDKCVNKRNEKCEGDEYEDF